METDLARLRRQSRIVYFATLAGFIAFLAVFLLWIAGLVPHWEPAIAELPLLGWTIWLTSKLVRTRVRDLFVGDESVTRFAAPATSGAGSVVAVMPMIAALIVAKPILYKPISVTKIFALLVLLGLIASGIVAWTRYLRRVGATRLELHPSGLRVPIAFGSFALGWDDLHEVAIDRRSIRLRFPAGVAHHANGASLGTRNVVVLIVSLVDPRWLVDVIQQYLDNPEARSAIGTAVELDRLRNLDFPAPTRSSKPAL